MNERVLEMKLMGQSVVFYVEYDGEEYRTTDGEYWERRYPESWESEYGIDKELSAAFGRLSMSNSEADVRYSTIRLRAIIRDMKRGEGRWTMPDYMWTVDKLLELVDPQYLESRGRYDDSGQESEKG